MTSTYAHAFEEAYARLNKQQRRAVDTIDGPVMVIAGPGTGKTQILTLRIANILQKTDTAPENILALTFTDAGAHAMRSRLGVFLGKDAYRVPIMTFHAFAGRLIAEHSESFPRIIGGRVATDIEKIKIVRDIIESGKVPALRPLGDPMYYVKKIQSAISEMKREYIRPDDFAAIITAQEQELDAMPRIHEKGAHKGKERTEYKKKAEKIQKNRELLIAYRMYEALMREQKIYDYDDMIIETVHALENNESFLLELQETYQYILADEHQDVNASQNKILELLSSYHDHPNIFVVGDEKQAIYRFQGASLENFLYFDSVFGKTEIIQLTDNYRSGQQVLDSAHALIGEDVGPAAELRVPLTAFTKDAAIVEYREFSHEAVEDGWVVDSIVKEVESGVPYEEIAILVRTNAEVETYARMLRAKGVPVSLKIDRDVLTHPILMHVELLLRAIVSPSDEGVLFEVLHGAYWGIPPEDLVRVVSRRSYGMPLSSVVADENTLKDAQVSDPSPFLRMRDALKTSRVKAQNESPQTVLEYVIRESGLFDFCLRDDTGERGRILRRFYDDVESMVVSDRATTMRDIVAHIELRRSYGLPLVAPYIRTDPTAVQIMTAHGSKGLEFHTVFVPHLIDSKWGGKKKVTYFDIPLTHHLNADDFDPIDDERRLFYVAMTRAKRVLNMTSSTTGATGKIADRTRLLSDAVFEFAAEVDTGADSDVYDPVSVFSRPPHDADEQKKDRDLLVRSIRERFLDQGLSVTALNNYLKDPWNYYFRSLLRIPEIKPAKAQFGTAMHSVLERVVRNIKDGGTFPSASELGALIGSALSRLPVSTHEYAELHQKALVSLTVYFEHLAGHSLEESKTEYKIHVPFETGDVDVPEVMLTGVFDRVDYDKGGNIVRIVDYKTGKSKTRAFIAGETKDSDGEYKRQLVFYSLLLSLRGDPVSSDTQYIISFVEPNARGEISEEIFTIPLEEIENLKAEIIRVAKEIASGAFLDIPCNPQECAYCHLVPRGV